MLHAIRILNSANARPGCLISKYLKNYSYEGQQGKVQLSLVRSMACTPFRHFALIGIAIWLMIAVSGCGIDQNYRKAYLFFLLRQRSPLLPSLRTKLKHGSAMIVNGLCTKLLQEPVKTLL